MYRGNRITLQELIHLLDTDTSRSAYRQMEHGFAVWRPVLRLSLN
jgi:hypothetical protein